MNYKQLLLFRQQVYDLLNFAKDATFELTDAVLTTRNAYSLAEFSLSPCFRRKWQSIYEALQECRPSRNKLMRLYIKQMPAQERPILAVDPTVWTRLHSPTLACPHLRTSTERDHLMTSALIAFRLQT